MAVYVQVPRRRKYLTHGVLLDSIVSLPDAAGERWFLQDLPHMGGDELRREQAKLDLRCLMEERPHWWFEQRRTAIDAELRGRRG